jgi:hypothetical protein
VAELALARPERRKRGSLRPRCVFTVAHGVF